jgi:hypothetical protein
MAYRTPDGATRARCSGMGPNGRDGRERDELIEMGVGKERAPTCKGIWSHGHRVRGKGEASAHDELGDGRHTGLRMLMRMVIVILGVVPFGVHHVGIGGSQGREVIKSRQTQTCRCGGEGRRSRTRRMEGGHYSPSATARLARTCDVRCNAASWSIGMSGSEAFADRRRLGS